MLSQDQERKKQLKILKVAKYFVMKGGPSIEEVSKATGISSSSVQRYLNDPYISQLCSELGLNNPEETIQDLLYRNKQEGLKKGGHNYSINNIASKDKEGKFTGSRKRK